MELKEGYKQTEIGVIPEDWEVATLETLGEFKNGINKDKDSFGSGYPFVNLLDVFGNTHINLQDVKLSLVESSAQERSGYNLRKGDILFVRSSVKPEGVGLTTVLFDDFPNAVFSGFLIRFRSNDRLDILFKEQCFNETNFRKRLIENSTVSANTNINQQELKKLSIALPPSLSEQCAIASALSDVDALLSGLDALISKKRNIKKATMQELLTGKKRLPGFSEEWVEKRLDAIGTFIKGRGISRSEAHSGLIPCIRYGEIYTHHTDIIKNFYSFISREVAQNAARLQSGDILFTCSGETKEDIGKSVAFTGSGEAYAGGDIIILRNTQECPEFLGYRLNAGDVSLQKSSAGQGDAVVHISATSLGAISVTLPQNTTEQAAIAAVLTDMDAEIAALESRRAKVLALKQGMMQELLTGRTRLLPEGE